MPAWVLTIAGWFVKTLGPWLYKTWSAALIDWYTKKKKDKEYEEAVNAAKKKLLDAKTPQEQEEAFEHFTDIVNGK